MWKVKCWNQARLIPMTKSEMEWVRHLLKDCFERLCHTENMTWFYQSNLFDVSSICALILSTFIKYGTCSVFINRWEINSWPSFFFFFEVLFWSSVFPCQPVFLVIVVSRVNSHDLIWRVWRSFPFSTYFQYYFKIIIIIICNWSEIKSK